MEILGDLLQVRIQFFLDVSTGGQVFVEAGSSFHRLIVLGQKMLL